MKKTLLILLIILGYIFISYTGIQSFKTEKVLLNKMDCYQKSHLISHYQLLADSFLKGNLNLPITPTSEFLKLTDPYDPVANKKFRDLYYGDLSFYKGKFYLYFSPVPALLFNLPFRLLVNYKLPDRVIVLFFVSGMLVFSTLILSLIRKRYFLDTPEWMMLPFIGMLGISNLGIYIMFRPSIYSVAISGGCLFMLGAVYFLLRVFNNDEHRRFLLFMSSLFLGLACGCKCVWIFSSLVILILVFFKLQRLTHGFKRNELFLNMLILIGPFLVCCILLGVYNYLRFDNFFEFGFRYQIQFSNLNKLSHFSFSNYLSNLYYYLFHPPLLDGNFPYVHLNRWLDYIKLRPIEHNIKDEEVVGIFYYCPFLILAVLYPVFIYIFNLISGKKLYVLKKLNFPVFELSLFIIPVIVNFSFYLFFLAVQFRYLTDFLTFALLAGCTLLLHLNLILGGKSLLKGIINCLVLVLSLISVVIGIVISIP